MKKTKKSRPTPSPIEIVNLVEDKFCGGLAMDGELVLTLDADGVAGCWLHTIGSSAHLRGSAWETLIEIHWAARAPSGSLARPDPDRIKTMLETIVPLLERVHAGHYLEYQEDEDSPIRGDLTEDAQDAVDEIQDVLEDTVWWILVVDGYDWLESCGPEDLPVTASSTDEELKALADDLNQRAYDESDVLLDDIYYALADIRERLQDEEVA